MAFSSSLLFFLGFISIADIAFSICISPNQCIDDIEDLTAQNKYDDVIEKYETVNIKIQGRPLGLHGKTITRGMKTEEHLVFHFVDNTVNDVIQSCTFVVSHPSEECEVIRLYCSGFLANPPRALLKLDPLTVCGDEVRVGIEEPETETEPEAEAVTEDASTEADSTKAPDTTTSSKFRMFN